MNSDGLKIRTATNLDCDAVQELVFSVLVEYGLTPEPDGTDADLRDLVGVYIGPGGIFEVLVDEHQRIVGCYGLYAISDTVCELRKMYLHPGVRGQGWGKSVLIRAIEQAKQIGFLTLDLETANCLKEAIALYRKFGFVEKSGAPNVERCDLVFTMDLTKSDVLPSAGIKILN
ncbi:MAG: GNAT family N-acetyltransferase [Gammaproteobacteria bacterium]|nr:GNAT family N-acetyltransferase [Gammaproteobacteria bacterium]